MLRDNLRNTEYFNEAISHCKDRINQYEVRISNSEQLNPIGRVGASVGLFGFALNHLEFSYSRGDGIGSSKQVLVKLLKYREMQQYYADALPKEDAGRRLEWERLGFSHYKKILTWLAFAVSVGANQEYFEKLFLLVDNQGLDAVFDKIAVKLGDVDRAVSGKVLHAKPYSLLLEVIEAAPEQQVQLMIKFMDAWYPACVKNGFYETHNITNNFGYAGYWCFEAALVAKVFNIDDSGFKDHKYYPAALMHEE